MFSLGLKCVKWLLFLTKLETSFVKWPKYRPETTFLRSSLSPRSQLTLAVCCEGRVGKPFSSRAFLTTLKHYLSHES